MDMLSPDDLLRSQNPGLDGLVPTLGDPDRQNDFRVRKNLDQILI